MSKILCALGFLYVVCLVSFFFFMNKEDVTYIKTSHGYVDAEAYYCELGMLLNVNRWKMYDLNEKPISCSEYVVLTNKEYKALVNKTIYRKEKRKKNLNTL